MNRKPRDGHKGQQNGKYHVAWFREFVHLHTLLESTDKNIQRDVDQDCSRKVPEPSLRMIDRIDGISLKPIEKEELDDEHERTRQSEQPVFRPSFLMDRLHALPDMLMRDHMDKD